MKRAAAIEIGRTKSGKRVASTRTRFAAVRNATFRMDLAAAKRALRRALPEYGHQDFLDAATIYRGLPECDWIAHLCVAVGCELAIGAPDEIL